MKQKRRNGMKFSVILIAGLALMLVAGVSEANLLTDSDFEASNQGPWWGLWGNNLHTGTFPDAGTGIGSSNSVKIVSNGAAGTGDDYYMYDNSLVSVTPGTAYYGSIFAKTQNLANEEISVKIDWFNNGAWVGTAGSSPTITGTNDWTALSISGVAPVNANHASLAFFVNQTADGGTGTAYFDNASLDTQPIPEPTSLLLLGSGLAGLLGLRKRAIK